MSLAQLYELLLPYRRRQGLEGDFDAPLGLFLKAALALLEYLLHAEGAVDREAVSKRIAELRGPGALKQGPVLP